MNTMYQKLKTGQYPWDTDTPFTDMVSARTGGTKQVYHKQDNQGPMGHGGWEAAPERALTPGLFKDIFQARMHGLGEVENKLNTGMKSIWAGATQMDYKGDPIGDPDAGWLKNAIEYALEQDMPITIKNLTTPRAKGSNIGGPGTIGAIENILGVRQAPQLFQNPNYESNERLRREKAFQSREAKERARRMRNEEPEGGGYGGINR
jgi:hypothetical protein